MEEVARPSLRPQVYASYRQIVLGHLKPALGNTRLTRLAPDAVPAYLNQKTAEGLAANTMRNHHSVLRRALWQAERWGLVPRNVGRLASPPRVPHHEIEPLTVAQARRFLAAVRSDRLEALYQVALARGLRQSEVLGLSGRTSISTLLRSPSVPAFSATAGHITETK